MCERGLLFTEVTELLCIIKYKGSNNKVLVLYNSTIKEYNVLKTKQKENDALVLK